MEGTPEQRGHLRRSIADEGYLGEASVYWVSLDAGNNAKREELMSPGPGGGRTVTTIETSVTILCGKWR
jgi:hypothetical protein